jgi:AbrB family looped-hinge helix DNA binding protein
VTATVNGQGQLVLRTGVREKLELREGDLLRVKREKDGRFVLEKRKPRRSSKGFLNPPRLDPSVLNEIYSSADPGWDALEREAVYLSQRALTGEHFDSL